MSSTLIAMMNYLASDGRSDFCFVSRMTSVAGLAMYPQPSTGTINLRPPDAVVGFLAR